MLWGLLRYGVFAGVEHKPIISLGLRCIVDIGANKGQFALACTLWAPDAQIISFEPLPGPCNIFRRLFARSRNVKLFECAVAPMVGSRVIHVSAQEDSSSLLPIGLNQIAHFPGTHEANKMPIKVAPLSHCLSRNKIVSPALLKLDVQGYELEALRGCETLLDMFEYVYCECSFIELYKGQVFADEVIAWLSKCNFKLIGVFNLSYDNAGCPIQGDFLFKNQTSIS